MKSVKVQFNTSSKEYQYLVPEGDDPQLGDYIITGIGTSSIDLTFARVTRVCDYRGPFSTKFYLWLVPQATITARMKANLDFMQREREREEAVSALEKMVQAEDRMAVYERIALTNPEAAALLAKIKG